MHKFVIMGIQGSGKGTQAALLARDLDLIQIGVGDMFRWHVQNHTKIMGPTHHKQITNYDGEFPAKAPIRQQDHKNDPPLRLRNIWVRPLP